MTEQLRDIVDLNRCPLADAAFRGRNSMHRVTPVEGDRTRMLVVFAYNTEPGISLSESARMTFYGRLAWGISGQFVESFLECELPIFGVVNSRISALLRAIGALNLNSSHHNLLAPE